MEEEGSEYLVVVAQEDEPLDELQEDVGELSLAEGLLGGSPALDLLLERPVEVHVDEPDHHEVVDAPLAPHLPEEGLQRDLELVVDDVDRRQLRRRERVPRLLLVALRLLQLRHRLLVPEVDVLDLYRIGTLE